MDTETNQLLTAKKIYMRTVLLSFSLMLFISVKAQTKKETMEWISNKLNASPNNYTEYECNRNGHAFAWGTEKISSSYDSNKDELKITFLTNYSPTTGGVKSVEEDGLNAFSTYFTITFNSTYLFNKVAIAKPVNCEVPNNVYKITFYAKKADNGKYGIQSPSNSFSELSFPIALGYDDDLPSRLQKSFDHLLSFSKTKEAF